jgi:hypothetical protein
MTQQALISPNELIYNYATPPAQIGVRIAQTVPDGEEFPVAEPLYWVSCADGVDASTYYWDGSAAVVKPIAPTPVEPPKPTLAELQAQLAALSAQIASLGAN